MKLSRQRAISVATILLLAISAFSGAPAHSDEVARKIISGWMPYYSTTKSMASIETNTAYVKEVMPFWYTLKYNAVSKKITILDLYSQLVGPKGTPGKTIIESLTAQGKIAIPTITDGTSKGVLAGLLANPKSRTEAVTVITALVMDNKYAGIDLDFEGFAFVDGNTSWNATAPSWVAFIKELGVSLHAKGKILSVTTPYVLDPKAAQKGYYVYAWAKIASSIDRLRIMTYDYSVSRPGPLGPISWTEKTIQYAVSIMPASKVYVGLPGYARGWITQVTGICPVEYQSTIKTSSKASTIAMSTIRDLRLTYGFVPTYDETFQEMTFSYEKTYTGLTANKLATSCTAKRVFWYQDQKALAVRAALVPKYKLGGVALWTFGMEDENAFDGIRAVAQAYSIDTVNSELAVDKTELEYGQPITLTGTLTIKDKKPYINAPVSIERYSDAIKDWVEITKATTGPDGKITKPLLIGVKSRIRITTKESEFFTDSVSNEVKVAVSRKVSVNSPASVKRGESFTVTGTVFPRNSGTFMTVETLVNGKWSAVGSPTPTDVQGNFTFAIPGQSIGVMTLRVSAAAELLYPIATTPQFSILIRSSSRPELVK